MPGVVYRMSRGGHAISQLVLILQWEKVCKTGNFKRPPCAAGEEILPTGEVATIGSLMAFDGAAPELINGRLAMVGFFAALGAEVHSGEGVMMQVRPLQCVSAMQHCVRTSTTNASP